MGRRKLYFTVQEVDNGYILTDLSEGVTKYVFKTDLAIKVKVSQLWDKGNRFAIKKQEVS